MTDYSDTQADTKPNTTRCDHRRTMADHSVGHGARMCADCHKPTCSTPGCLGDPNYVAPGRGHRPDCMHLRGMVTTSDTTTTCGHPVSARIVEMRDGHVTRCSACPPLDTATNLGAPCAYCKSPPLAPTPYAHRERWECGRVGSERAPACYRIASMQAEIDGMRAALNA